MQKLRYSYFTETYNEYNNAITIQTFWINVIIILSLIINILLSFIIKW